MGKRQRECAGRRDQQAAAAGEGFDRLSPNGLLRLPI
jgi:hypothetical protein